MFFFRIFQLPGEYSIWLTSLSSMQKPRLGHIRCASDMQYHRPRIKVMRRYTQRAVIHVYIGNEEGELSEKRRQDPGGTSTQHRDIRPPQRVTGAKQEAANSRQALVSIFQRKSVRRAAPHTVLPAIPPIAARGDYPVSPRQGRRRGKSRDNPTNQRSRGSRVTLVSTTNAVF